MLGVHRNIIIIGNMAITMVIEIPDTILTNTKVLMAAILVSVEIRASEVGHPIQMPILSHSRLTRAAWVDSLDSVAAVVISVEVVLQQARKLSLWRFVYARFVY